MEWVKGRDWNDAKRGIPRRVFKDYSNQHCDLRRPENRFLGLTSVWKLVFRADIGMETGFHAAALGRNADWNHL